MIKSIIIEDDQRSRNMLHNMIKEHFKNIHVAAVCESVVEGKAAIESVHPDLVFSDIELKNDSVFDMLRQITFTNFDIIFTTAYERYAIQAIKFSALDYLLKPFSLSDLSEAINHYLQKQNKRESSDQFDTLLHNLKHTRTDSKKIALPTLNGLEIVSVKDIIRCESDMNYTTFFLSSKNKIVVSKTLKEFEGLLDEYDFVRVHNCHLINLRHVKNYVKGEGGIVRMIDGAEVDVSRRKKDEFLKRLADL